MQKLKFKEFLSLKLLIIQTIALSSFLLFFISPDSNSHRVLLEVWNLGHFFLFFLITFVYFKFSKKQPRTIKDWALFLLLCFFIALSTEIAQIPLAHRSFSLNDLITDLLGCIYAAIIFLYLKNKVSLKNTIIATVSTILILLPRLSYLLMDEWKMQKAFPVLASFESGSEHSRWGGNNVAITNKLAKTGTHSLQVQVGDNKYSGTGLKHFVRDWQEFDSLHFSIWVASSTTITLRVNDQQHFSNNKYEDRFNVRLNLTLGWNNFELPLDKIRNAPSGRKMDMENIAAVGWFSTKPHDVSNFYIDNVLLKKKSQQNSL